MAGSEKFWWEDKTVQVPKGLAIKGVSGEAVGVYFKMKGFGAETRCSLAALATRLGWSVAKTRKYQNELLTAGWIVLLVEGHGGGKEGEKAIPRQWWMCSAPGETPPQELVARVSKNGTLPKSMGLEKQGACFSIPEANKEVQGLQANKEELPAAGEVQTPPAQEQAPQAPPSHVSPPAAPRPATAGDILKTFRGWWKTRHNGKFYVDEPGIGDLALKLSKSGAPIEVIEECLRIWPHKADDFVRDKVFPFWLFVREFHRLQEALPKGPACQHPPEAFELRQEFKNGDRFGRCSACGKPVTINAK